MAAVEAVAVPMIGAKLLKVFCAVHTLALEVEPAVEITYGSTNVPLPVIVVFAPAVMKSVMLEILAFHVDALEIYESTIGVPFHTPVAIVPTAVSDDVMTFDARTVPDKRFAEAVKLFPI